MDIEKLKTRVKKAKKHYEKDIKEFEKDDEDYSILLGWCEACDWFISLLEGKEE